MSANTITAEVGRNREFAPETIDGGTPHSWEGIVRQLVGGLRFGVVQITVHESHVVQVERTEKVRFAQAPKPNR